MQNIFFERHKKALLIRVKPDYEVPFYFYVAINGQVKKTAQDREKPDSVEPLLKKDNYNFIGCQLEA